MVELHVLLRKRSHLVNLIYRRSLFVSLLCMVVFVFSASAASYDAPVRQGALDQGKAEAATLLKQRKFSEAYRLFSRLLRESPEDDAISLGLARSAMGANRPYQAVMAYERLLEKYPGESSLHKEISQAFMSMGDRASAQRYLESATIGGVADPQAPTERRDRFHIHGKLSAGLIYDSNVNQGPASNDVTLGMYRVQLLDSAEKESGGAYLGGSLDLGYRLGDTSSWWLVGNGNFYLRGNENNDLAKHDARYSEWFRLSAGLRLLTPDTLMDVRLKAEVFDYEWYQSVYAVGPEALFVYAPSSWFQLIGRAGLDRRDYTRDRDRNGEYGYAGPYARFFFGQAQHEIMVGARYLGGRAERSDYSYDGWETSASFRFKLPHGFEFLPSLGYTREHYCGPATAIESANRKDKRFHIGAGLNYKIDEAWSLELSYRYTKNDSVSELYDYERHLVTTGITWSF